MSTFFCGVAGFFFAAFPFGLADLFALMRSSSKAIIEG
jgi:hypothetical protein